MLCKVSKLSVINNRTSSLKVCITRLSRYKLFSCVFSEDRKGQKTFFMYIPARTYIQLI